MLPRQVVRVNINRRGTYLNLCIYIYVYVYSSQLDSNCPIYFKLTGGNCQSAVFYHFLLEGREKKKRKGWDLKTRYCSQPRGIFSFLSWSIIHTASSEGASGQRILNILTERQNVAFIEWHKNRFWGGLAIGQRLRGDLLASKLSFIFTLISFSSKNILIIFTSTKLLSYRKPIIFRY